MYDHNTKKHALICLEHDWTTKHWPRRPFAFLFDITEVNVNLAETYFVRNEAPRPQVEFRKLIAKDLINNEYLIQEISEQELWRSKRKLALTAHCLQSLPPFTKLIGTKIRKVGSKYPQDTCTSGHQKVCTYCVCSSGILQSNQCFAIHCVEIDNDGERSD